MLPSTYIFFGSVCSFPWKCVLMETLIQVETRTRKLSNRGSRSRKKWMMKAALFRRALCSDELRVSDAKEVSNAGL